MILILSNSQDATADYLASILNSRDFPIIRLDTDTAIAKTTFRYSHAQPQIIFDGNAFLPEAITNVWYRRPEKLRRGPLDDSPEGKFTLEEWAEAFEGFFAHIPQHRWMNHPACNFAASHKIEQLSTARNLGLVVPETLVTQNPEELRLFFHEQDGRLIVKPIFSGYVERATLDTDSLIYTNLVSADHLQNLDDLGSCPTLFQRFVEKKADVRITVVDRALHAVALVARDKGGGQRCDIRRNDMNDVEYDAITIPAEIETKIRRLVAHYRLRFAAIDMAVGTDGCWYFFEINPNGQWAWLDLDAGMNIAESFLHAFST